MHNDKGKEEIICSWIKAVCNLKKCCYLWQKSDIFCGLIWAEGSTVGSLLADCQLSFSADFHILVYWSLMTDSCLQSTNRQLANVGGQLFFNFAKLSNLKSLSSDQLTLMWLIISNFSVVPHHGHNTPDSYDRLTLLLQNKVLNNIHTRQSQTNSSWIWVTPIQSAKSNNIINEYLYLIPSICI